MCDLSLLSLVSCVEILDVESHRAGNTGVLVSAIRHRHAEGELGLLLWF